MRGRLLEQAAKRSQQMRGTVVKCVAQSFARMRVQHRGSEHRGSEHRGSEHRGRDESVGVVNPGCNHSGVQPMLCIVNLHTVNSHGIDLRTLTRPLYANETSVCWREHRGFNSGLNTIVGLT
jgi:hypothetical protein